MSNPEDLLYSASHEWAKVNGEEAVLGITHFAQESLGDITYVDMPAEGDELTAGSEFGQRPDLARQRHGGGREHRAGERS